nr:hypothetical protein [uncultured Sphingomonas sp.]
MALKVGSRLGLVGMNASGTKRAAAIDWTATADWDGQMRETMGEGLPFVYVTCSSSVDVEIDFSQQTGVDIAQIDPAWLRRQSGVVLQETCCSAAACARTSRSPTPRCRCKS